MKLSKEMENIIFDGGVMVREGLFSEKVKFEQRLK